MTSEMVEEITLDHFIHEHPLSLVESDKGDECSACFRRFTKEAAYGCKKCGDEKVMLHRQCAEMPIKIRHPMHPQHTLVQQRGDGSRDCALCGRRITRIGYFCSSSICEFQIHLACAPAKGMKHVDDQQISIMHPSHPEHELILVKKRHSIECDACGTMETGRSYQCLACQYWIHERCAALPATAGYHHHHHHPLSLAFYLPIEYIKFNYVCDVCNKDLVLNSWVYHCELCRFVVHIKCAVGPSLLPTADEDANEADSQGLIRFPISEAHEEIIKPFVMRERGEIGMPRDDKKQYLLSTHHHPLSLVSSSISEINNDDDDDLNYGQIKAELVCDACTMHLFQKHKNNPSSSSSSSSDYMSCGECKYFLHLACFHLPPELPSHPFHEADHKLILKAIPKDCLGLICSMCGCVSNGVFYSCTKCKFKADVKCACLPNTIQHEAHPHHHLHSNFISLDGHASKMVRQGICGGCRNIIVGGIFYKCGICDFLLCSNCVFLPPTNKHESDKHPLPLRYDANLDHPDDFYCDECEREMDPKAWMYHCRGCDTSFHPKCFLATSGYCRNIKFGEQYRVAAALHPHPLTFQLLTTKLRCDVCRLRIYGEEDVDQVGFHCWSCNFFACTDCIERCLGHGLIDYSLE